MKQCNFSKKCRAFAHAGSQKLFSSLLVSMLCLTLTAGCGEESARYHLDPKISDDLQSTFDRLKAEDDLEELGRASILAGNDTKTEEFALRRRRRPQIVSLEQLEALGPSLRMVPIDRIILGSTIVPSQQDGWSCGLNSAARFSAMLGHPIADYKNFHSKGPNYGGFLFIPKIGANPGGIQNYLRGQDSLRHFSISQCCSRAFHVQWEIMVRSLGIGRPALVLVMNSGTLLHWINIIARDDRSGDWYYMDTNGEVYRLPGGDDELKHWMNHGNCLAQKLTFVERFNTVTATQDK
jgi:hypothetical protein